MNDGSEREGGREGGRGGGFRTEGQGAATIPNRREGGRDGGWGGGEEDVSIYYYSLPTTYPALLGIEGDFVEMTVLIASAGVEDAVAVDHAPLHGRHVDGDGGRLQGIRDRVPESPPAGELGRLGGIRGIRGIRGNKGD